MKKGILFIVLFVLNNLNILYALEDKIPIGARSGALMNAYTAIADDADAIVLNPAGLGNIKSIWFNVSTYRLYNMFISHTLVSGIIPLPHHLGSAGVLWRSMDYSREFGFKDREEGMSLAYGKKIYSFSIGINFQYQWLLSDSDTVLLKEKRGSLDIGLLYQLQNKIKFGFVGENIYYQKFSGIKTESMSPLYKFGVSYFYRKWLLVIGEVQTQSNDFYGSIGTEFIIGDYLKLRGGLNEQLKFGLGIGIKMQRLYLDYAYQSGINNFFPTHILSFAYSAPVNY